MHELLNKNVLFPYIIKCPLQIVSCLYFQFVKHQTRAIPVMQFERDGKSIKNSLKFNDIYDCVASLSNDLLFLYFYKVF